MVANREAVRKTGNWADEGADAEKVKGGYRVSRRTHINPELSMRNKLNLTEKIWTNYVHNLKKCSAPLTY